MKNIIIIHGYLGRKPELTYKDGRNGRYAHVSFSVGVSRDFGDETDWFFCSMNGKRAETIEKFFDKGSQIMIVGRMRSYRPQGEQRDAWVLDVQDFDFCDKKDSPRGQNNRASYGEPEQNNYYQSQSSYEPEPNNYGQQMELPDSFEAADDDIPF